MKRITAAALAATTAVSVFAMPAQAAETSKPASSSEVSDEAAAAYLVAAALAEAISPGTGISAPFKSSSDKGLVTADITSSLRNDAYNGYKVGTTYDILVGTGIAAAVLAVLGVGAAAAGVIPGVTLPALPF